MNLTRKEILKLSVASTIGVFVPISIIIILTMLLGLTSGINFNGEDVSGIKGVLIFLIFLPLYLIMYIIFNFVFLYLGIKLFYLLKINKLFKW